MQAEVKYCHECRRMTEHGQEPLACRECGVIDQVPAVAGPVSIERGLVKDMAMDIGKAVALHIEIQYPAAVAAVGSTFLLSVRNCVHNEIMAAVEHTDPDAIRARLRERKQWRRNHRAIWKRNRET